MFRILFVGTGCVQGRRYSESGQGGYHNTTGAFELKNTALEEGRPVSRGRWEGGGVYQVDVE